MIGAEISMQIRNTIAIAAMLMLVAGAALARDDFDDRDSGASAHQTELDREYARTHPVLTPGTPPALGTSSNTYGYVPPHRPKAKHR
jgi:hypothetical protein